MNKSLQSQLEDEANNILFEIEDELDFNTGKIPEIYYVGKTTSFEKLGLDEIHEDDFDWVKKSKSALVLFEEKIIFSGNLNRGILGEEIGHYLHFLHSKFKAKTDIGRFYFGALTEMLGFFSSKLIDSKRQNGFSSLEDLFLNQKTFEDHFKIILKESKKGFLAQEDLIYTQGYKLGEKMFDYYISGLFPKEKIKDIFMNPLKKEYEAIDLFHKLKYEILI